MALSTGVTTSWGDTVPNLVSGTYTPTNAGLLVLIAVTNTALAPCPDPTNISGNSITGVTKLASQGFATNASPGTKVTLWAAISTATAGALTVTIGGTPTGCLASATEIIGAFPRQGNMGLAQIATAWVDGGASTLVTLNLNPFASTQNGSYLLIGGSSSGTTPKTGWTELVDTAYVTPSGGLETQFNALADPTPQGTPGAGTSWGAVAVEIWGVPVTTPARQTLLQPQAPQILPASRFVLPSHTPGPVALAGAGAAATAGPALLVDALTLTGAGAAASAGPALLVDTVALAGKGTAAAASPNTLLNLAAYLQGHGDAAAASPADQLNLAAAYRGHGDAAAAGPASLVETVALTGTGTAAAGSQAPLNLAASFTGTGTAAAAGPGALKLAANLFGHGDAANAGPGSLNLADFLFGHGDAATAGPASLTVSSVGGNAVPLTGTGTAAAAGPGLLVLSAYLAGTGAAASAGQALFIVAESLAGAGAASTGARAPLNLAAYLAGNGAGAMSSQAFLQAVLALTGHGDAASAGPGSLDVHPLVVLAGFGAVAAASPTALLQLVLAFAGSGAAAAAGVASGLTGASPDLTPESLTIWDRNHTVTIHDTGHTATLWERV